MTRTQLLRQRGYDEATIAGTNGHMSDDLTNAEPSRTCRGCGASLEHRAPSTIWCGDTCKRRYRDTHPQDVQQADGLAQLVTVAQALTAAGMRLTLTVGGVDLAVMGK